MGTLLELYRNYLKLLAGTEISLHLQTRANPSDVVQDTFFEACRDFKQFRGTTEAEFLAWLRRILVRNLARLVERHVLTKKRDQRRELSLDQLAASLEALLLAAGDGTGRPSDFAQHPTAQSRTFSGAAGRSSGPLAGRLPRGARAAAPGGAAVRSGRPTHAAFQRHRPHVMVAGASINCGGRLTEEGWV